jgi:hypothetical protein
MFINIHFDGRIRQNSEVSSPTEISKVSIGDDDSTEDIEMTAHNEVVMKFCPF